MSEPIARIGARTSSTPSGPTGFSATEAVLRFLCLLHNLIGEFQPRLEQRPIRTRATLRTTLFACGAILGVAG